MRIGVISDTHDRLPTFRRALATFARLKVDAIFHAGDYVAPFAAKLIAPGTLATPNLVDGPLRVELDTPAGKRGIVMHHFIDWLKPGEAKGADVVISGHNHVASVEQRDRTLLLNPGECCGWVHDRCTVALLDLSGPQPTAEIIEVHS